MNVVCIFFIIIIVIIIIIIIMFIIYYNFNHQHRHCHPYYHYEPYFVITLSFLFYVLSYIFVIDERRSLWEKMTTPLYHTVFR